MLCISNLYSVKSLVSVGDLVGKREARRRLNGLGIKLPTLASNRTFYFYSFDTLSFYIRICFYKRALLLAKHWYEGKAAC